MVDPVPAGLDGRIIPYLMIDGAAAAIDFYVAAFGAEEEGRPGDARRDDRPRVDPGLRRDRVPRRRAARTCPVTPRAPPPSAGPPCCCTSTCPDVDAAVARAEAAGGTVLRAPEDQFYGDRASVVADPFGHQWALHTHIRDVSPEEMEQAVQQMG